jgi:transitional endoplasmic reticulum ATPase
MSDSSKGFEDFLDFKALEELGSKTVDQLLDFVHEIEEQLDPSNFGFDTSDQSRTNSSRQSPPSETSSYTRTVYRTQAAARTHSRAASPSAPSLSNVGGLSAVLQELQELIEIPLKRPEVLTKLGLEPTHGILLVGPPGTGKTLTARSLAHQMGVDYVAIVGPEIIGKYYGEAEERLRNLFEKAVRCKPCLIFIDEIDSLAPDRSRVEGEVEKRVVAQLLSLMDGFSEMEGVIVLAATNRPEQLDPALRRPGRFDREVQFRVPDRNGRLEILNIVTQAMPLDASVNMNVIADLAVGMVGADLKALAQKAAYNALRRQISSINHIPERLTVNQTDFLAAIEAVKPAVLRSVEVESPDVKWDEIGGLETVKQTLQESVEGALLYPELYQRTGATAPRGILLWGPPGTGKTLLAKAVASQARANFIAVNGPELLSKWVGATEQAVRELFSKARQAAPCVVFVDEIDSLAPARGRHQGDSGVSDRVVGQLLTELDGLKGCSNVLLIGATNRPEALDPALLRAGRLDLRLKVDLPDLPSRLSILQVQNSDRPLASDVYLAEWATQTEGWNGADLALLSNQAALQAIRRYRLENQSDLETLHITAADFQAAYETLLVQQAEAE